MSSLASHALYKGVTVVWDLDLDWDLDLGGLLTAGLGVGIITLLPWVLPHPDDLSHIHLGLVLSFV